MIIQIVAVTIENWLNIIGILKKNNTFNTNSLTKGIKLSTCAIKEMKTDISQYNITKKND